MTTQRVVLPPLAAPVDLLWHLLLDLRELLTVKWTVIGGQMVLLHALEHGRLPPQISQDGDVIADVRADPGALGSVTAALISLRFVSAGITVDGRSHRFERAGKPRPVVIDVLAPEGLGPRADLTTEPPGRTIEVPGGTQALSRTEILDIQHEGRQGSVPRPSLLGAVVAKGAACGLAGDVSRHLRDLALLCALVADPFEMKELMNSKDRRRVRLGEKLADSGHAAWGLVPADIRGQGYDAFVILTTEG
jgi:hypothetical protein